MNKPLKSLETINGKALFDMDIPPLQFAIDKILPHGLFILAGSPKVGKSCLALDFCVAVATGSQTWGYQAENGVSLYLALEDSYARLQSRLKKYTDSGIADIHYAIRSENIQTGVVAQITDFIEQYKNTRLVIIDTAQHIRNNVNDSKNAYANDYADMNALRELTDRFGITLLLVTHTRKMFDNDPLNMILGSTGFVGASDGVFVLEKELRTANKGKNGFLH
ncbi:hypothetical protein FACS1894188_05200 [Clostridia bacterium]|nr:hypothetical protein FACS1894188_05200 [Clostridia bacterium]